MADPITYWVYQCAGTRGTATSGLGPAVYPTCNPSGQGGWIQIQQVTQTPFDPQTLDAQGIANAFGFGFISVGAVCLGLWAISRLIDVIKRS